MIDAFVLLTPILLLLIIALLGFVGCQLVFPLNPPPAVAHVQTIVKTGLPGTDTITADPLSLEGGELIAATVQWGSAAVQPPSPALTGANFAPAVGGGPFNWSGMKIQTFLATNPDNSTSVTVQAILPGGSNVAWNLCVSAYKNVDNQTPIFSPLQNGASFIGTNPQLPPINAGDGDIVYAVAFAADNDGTFPGSNSFVAGPGFTAEFPAVVNPIVEDSGSGNLVTAQATNTSPVPNPRGFIFAMAIKRGGS
jgi:hypothetical protein